MPLLNISLFLPPVLPFSPRNETEEATFEKPTNIYSSIMCIYKAYTHLIWSLTNVLCAFAVCEMVLALDDSWMTWLVFHCLILFVHLLDSVKLYVRRSSQEKTKKYFIKHVFWPTMNRICLEMTPTKYSGRSIKQMCAHLIHANGHEDAAPIADMHERERLHSRCISVAYIHKPNGQQIFMYFLPRK